MRKLFVLIPILITTLLLTACTQKPENVRQEIWDEGTQFVIHYKRVVDGETEEDHAGEILNRMNAWAETKELTKEEEEIKREFLSVHKEMLLYQLAKFSNGDTDKAKEEFNKKYKEAEEILGANNLKDSKFDESLFNSIIAKQSEKDSKAEQEDIAAFKSLAGVTKTADEVQYNMPNNLDEVFYLEGELELCDYYNYGYTNETDYFCGRLTPTDGNYSNSWYLYFQRNSFKGVYNILLNGSTNDILIAAKVIGRVYESGQGNMAVVTRTTGKQ